MREPSRELVEVVNQSTLPAVLVRVPTGEFVAASREAARLLGLPRAEMIGRSAAEFVEGAPDPLLEDIVSGHITGFQARRVLARTDGEHETVQLWLRAAEVAAPVEFAVVIVWPTGRAAWSYLPGPETVERHQVIGVVNERLEIERVSDDVRSLGVTAEDAVGGTLFRLFDLSSAADVLNALSEATNSRKGVCLIVNVTLDGAPAMAQLMIEPLQPSPSFAFSFVCPGGEWQADTGLDDRSLQQMGRGLHALALADTHARLSESKVPGVEKLSTRELEITARLLAGDRVPAIAQAVFLSQSTVRNHLSSVFRKLHVTSQQQLIELFRESAERLSQEDTSSSTK